MTLSMPDETEDTEDAPRAVQANAVGERYRALLTDLTSQFRATEAVRYGE